MNNRKRGVLLFRLEFSRKPVLTHRTEILRRAHALERASEVFTSTAVQTLLEQAFIDILVTAFPFKTS